MTIDQLIHDHLSHFSPDAKVTVRVIDRYTNEDGFADVLGVRDVRHPMSVEILVESRPNYLHDEEPRKT